MDRGLRSSAVRSRSIALSGALYLRNNSASRMAVSTSLTCSDSDWELTIVCLMFGNSGWCFWGAPGSGGVYHRRFGPLRASFWNLRLTISYVGKVLRLGL